MGEAKKDNKSGAFTIAKTEPDKMLVFGWANVAIRQDGTQIADLQGDVIDPEELEKTAYEHVLKFRSTGEQHDPGLRQKGRLVESCMFTKEKQAAIGIPPGTVPEGWWVGYKIDDPTAWDKIKKGEYQMFSIEGTGHREPIAKSYEELRKFNPYHDQMGRFSDGNSFVMFSPGSNPNQAKRSIDRENAKRKQQGVEGEVTGAFVNMLAGGGGATTYAAARQAAADGKQAYEDKQKPQVTTPDKPGKSIQWAKMTDDEFVQGLDKTMPGLDRVENGYAKTHDSRDYVDTKQNGDMVLTDIYTQRGYNAQPTMMDRADIKQYIAQNGTPELYRGMGTSSSGQSGADKQTRFATDKLHFAGLGVLGNGTYAAETPPNNPYHYNTGLRVARNYSGRSPDGSVRMTLAKGTRTASFQTVRNQQRAFRDKVRSAVQTGAMDAARGQTILSITRDVGRFAALRGYEAYYDKTRANSGANKSHPFWVVLNRGKVIIQNERYT